MFGHPFLRYKGTWDCLSTSIRNEGAGVMYKGLVGTILREVPGTAAWFGAYETFVEVRGGGVKLFHGMEGSRMCVAVEWCKRWSGHWTTSLIGPLTGPTQ